MGVGKEVFEIWAILGFEIGFIMGIQKWPQKFDQNLKNPKKANFEKSRFRGPILSMLPLRSAPILLALKIEEFEISWLRQ